MRSWSDLPWGTSKAWSGDGASDVLRGEGEVPKEAEETHLATVEGTIDFCLGLLGWDVCVGQISAVPATERGGGEEWGLAL